MRDDEFYNQENEILWAGRESWRSMAGFYLQWTLIGAVPLVAAIFAGRSGMDNVPMKYAVLASIAIWTLMLLIGWLRRIWTRYLVTEQEITIERGIVARSVDTADLRHVRACNYRQTILDRMLGIGTVELATAASESYDFELRGVPNPKAMERRIRHAMHELRSGRAED